MSQGWGFLLSKASTVNQSCNGISRSDAFRKKKKAGSCRKKVQQILVISREKGESQRLAEWLVVAPYVNFNSSFEPFDSGCHQATEIECMMRESPGPRHPRLRSDPNNSEKDREDLLL